jgi:hypothetical protein
MTGLKFELDIDAAIQKMGLPPAKLANSANQGHELFLDTPSCFKEDK